MHLPPSGPERQGEGLQSPSRGGTGVPNPGPTCKSCPHFFPKVTRKSPEDTGEGVSPPSPRFLTSRENQFWVIEIEGVICW